MKNIIDFIAAKDVLYRKESSDRKNAEKEMKRSNETSDSEQ